MLYMKYSFFKFKNIVQDIFNSKVFEQVVSNFYFCDTVNIVNKKIMELNIWPPWDNALLAKLSYLKGMYNKWPMISHLALYNK